MADWDAQLRALNKDLSGLATPWSVRHDPDLGAFVTQQDGRDQSTIAYGPTQPYKTPKDVLAALTPSDDAKIELLANRMMYELRAGQARMPAEASPRYSAE